MNDLDRLKQEYNYNLKRYYKGCKYIEEHKEEEKKWLPEILRILDNMNELLKKIEKFEDVESNQMLKGFSL